MRSSLLCLLALGAASTSLSPLSVTVPVSANEFHLPNVIENDTDFCLIPSNVQDKGPFYFRHPSPVEVKVQPPLPAWIPAHTTVTNTFVNSHSHSFDFTAVDCNTHIPQASYRIGYTKGWGDGTTVFTLTTNLGVTLYVTSGASFLPTIHKTIISSTAAAPVPHSEMGTTQFYSDAACTATSVVYEMAGEISESQPVHDPNGQYILNGQSYNTEGSIQNGGAVSPDFYSAYTSPTKRFSPILEATDACQTISLDFQIPHLNINAKVLSFRYVAKNVRNVNVEANAGTGTLATVNEVEEDEIDADAEKDESDEAEEEEAEEDGTEPSAPSTRARILAKLRQELAKLRQYL